jgi:hypothetical protein
VKVTSGPRVAFVHDLGEAQLDDDIVIATTPSAWLACRDAGLPVSVLDDHVDRLAILPAPTEYTRWQLAWAARLDAAIGGGGAARTGFFLLKWPTDSVVLRGLLARAAIENLRPSAVRYVGPTADAGADPWHRGHLQFWTTLGDGPLLADVLPPICRAAGVPFSLLAVGAIAATREVHSIARIRGRLGEWRGRRRALAGLRSSHRVASLLLWTSGFGVGRAARGERDAGRRVLFLTHRKQSIAVREPMLVGLRRRSPDIFTTLRRAGVLSEEQLGLLREVDQWVAPGVSDALRTRFETYLLRVCPAISDAAVLLEPHLARLQVERVICATANSLPEHAALLAARRMGLERVIIQHGDQLVPVDSFFADIENFTEMVCSDPTVPSELETLNVEYGVQLPRLPVNPVRARQLERESLIRPEASEAVCYVASIYFGDNATALPSNYDDAWYARYAALVLEEMARRPTTPFLWKALPVGNLDAPDPVPVLIERLGAPNISYETRFFGEVVHEVGRVIVDYPSTPLFEAVAVGRPVLGLSFSRFLRLRPGVTDLFAPSLVECEDESAALAAIRRFLADDPARWIVPADRLLDSSGTS